MEFLKFTFYFIGVFFIIYELGWLLSPVDKAEEVLKLRALSKKYKGLKWEEYPDSYKQTLKTKVWYVVYLLWFIVGLFTFQWPVFLLFLAFNLAVISPISSALRSWFAAYTALHWLNSVIGLSFGVFVILNAYHLNIDVYHYLMNLIR